MIEALVYAIVRVTYKVSRSVVDFVEGLRAPERARIGLPVVIDAKSVEAEDGLEGQRAIPGPAEAGAGGVLGAEEEGAGEDA